MSEKPDSAALSLPKPALCIACATEGLLASACNCAFPERSIFPEELELESFPIVEVPTNPDLVENNDGFRIYRPPTKRSRTTTIGKNEP